MLRIMVEGHKGCGWNSRRSILFAVTSIQIPTMVLKVLKVLKALKVLTGFMGLIFPAILAFPKNSAVLTVYDRTNR